MKQPTKEAIDISRYISSFMQEYAPAHLTGSKNTIRSYETGLALYIGFLEQKGITPQSFNAGCFERKLIEDWLQWLSTIRKCSPATCNNRLASLRAFLKYLSSRDIKYIYLSNEVVSIKLRKTQRRKVNGLSRNAVKSLMEEPDAKDKIALRDLTFMVLLYATATRLDELLSLKVTNLHIEGEKPYITVLGKGNKLRTLYLLPRAVAHLKQYLKIYYGENPDPESYVFYSRTKGKNTKMTQAGISKMLKKYALLAHEKCADVPIELHAHQFRHAKASHWLEDGMNVVQISFLLGHAQLQTTLIYLEITTEQETKALATLENENDRKIAAKWKGKENTLFALCGLNSLKK